MAQALDNLEVSYTYHVHKGDSTNGGGCYDKENMVQFISKYETKYVSCTGRLEAYSDENGSSAKCNKCGFLRGAPDAGLVCGYARATQVPVYDTRQEGWLLNCGKTEETVESVTIKY